MDEQEPRSSRRSGGPGGHLPYQPGPYPAGPYPYGYEPPLPAKPKRRGALFLIAYLVVALILGALLAAVTIYVLTGLYGG